MVIPTEKTWHYIVGADAHIGPPSAPQVRRIWLSLWGMALRKQCQGASPQGTNAVCPSGRLRGFVQFCKSIPRPVNGPGRADMRAFRPLVRPLHDHSAMRIDRI